MGGTARSGRVSANEARFGILYPVRLFPHRVTRVFVRSPMRRLALAAALVVVSSPLLLAQTTTPSTARIDSAGRRRGDTYVPKRSRARHVARLVHHAGPQLVGRDVLRPARDRPA